MTIHSRSNNNSSSSPLDDAREKSGPRSERVPGLHLIGLCSLAIAQPLFDLLGRHGEFFVSHDASGAEIIWLTLGLITLPPLIAIALLWVARRVSPHAEQLPPSSQHEVWCRARQETHATQVLSSSISMPAWQKGHRRRLVDVIRISSRTSSLTLAPFRAARAVPGSRQRALARRPTARHPARGFGPAPTASGSHFERLRAD